MGEIKGWHVFSGFVLGFGVIIAVNMTLAINAVRTFPGLEVKNSYVASQSFEADRAAQTALGWDVSARVESGVLKLKVLQNGTPIAPNVETAIFGRATHIAEDETLQLVHNGTEFEAPVAVSDGNWNLRLRLRSADGKLFNQRISIKVAQ